MKHIIKFDRFVEGAEITPNNTTGNAGDTTNQAITQGPDGYMVSGNNGAHGITFTPSDGDTKSKTYKNRNTKKKVFRKNRKRHEEKDKDKKV